MGKVLGKRRLVPFSSATAPAVSVGVKLTRIGGDVLKIEFVVTGAIAGLRLPTPRQPEWGDELWLHSCFELFVSQPGEGYVEFNFAPSRQWAIYRFEGHRRGMQPAPDLPDPDIFIEEHGSERFALTVVTDFGHTLSSARNIGLSAVLETGSGAMSYWALAHPTGDKPDFHDPSCFTLELPPAV